MGIFSKLGIKDKGVIDWDITPDLSFTIFESWGSRVRIRSRHERYYYFFIDNWRKPARLCLMERGVKYARVLAEIAAPRELIDRCVAGQGKTAGLDRSYAINAELKQWLITNVLDPDDETKITPVASGLEVEDMATDLPDTADGYPPIDKIVLASEPTDISEADLPAIVAKHNFYDSRYNPQGAFGNYLIDNGDGLTVKDLATGLTWQRGGFDIASIRTMRNNVAEGNRQLFAGHDGWRLPTAEEALSLLEPAVNVKGLHIHPCFSKAQPFIFLADQRQPGGYWFIDFKQGTVFWASGFNPGGFGRLVTSE